MRPSFVQIAIVILIIVIIFGAPKLPQLARSLGQSMKIFKSEVKDLRDDDDDAQKSTEPGTLGRSSSSDSASSTGTSGVSGDRTGTDEASREKQDPQSHEK
ncbi:twin-arginine translocase TatA/TatE family subunit [Brevibacterium atlanticum]|uniref:twin-arginine translocase TatA/TatE family subunit n=1 Tax=Brevibacterium atlanticum TaxID=2697563 RepID=UPI00141E87EE|nr:twin-arginine translocase TatA/TatE family subunit [Brevibacterium atlanticum]